MFGIVISVGLILGGCEAFFALTIKQGSDLQATPIPARVSLPERPETLSDIQALLQSDGEDCQLPCFWGFRPGYSTEEEVFEFLQPVPIGNNAPELHYYFPEGPVQDSIFWLGFGVQEGIVSTIYVTLENPSEWLPAETLELPHLLSVMSSEPAIYFSINLSQRRYFLSLAYDEGVLVSYAFQLQVEGGIVSQNIDNPFLFCPTLDRNELIDLDLANEDAQTLLENSGTQHFISIGLVWTIERMTGLSVNEFIQQVIENPDECIELPSYPELIEIGYEF